MFRFPQSRLRAVVAERGTRLGFALSIRIEGSAAASRLVVIRHFRVYSSHHVKY